MLKLDVLVKDKDVIVSNQRLSDNVTSYLSITGIHVLLSECTIMPLARMNIIHYHSLVQLRLFWELKRKKRERIFMSEILED